MTKKKKKSRKVLNFLSPAVAHRVFEDDCDIRGGEDASKNIKKTRMMMII